jgi:hypothetical protein
VQQRQQRQPGNKGAQPLTEGRELDMPWSAALRSEKSDLAQRMSLVFRTKFGMIYRKNRKIV